ARRAPFRALREIVHPEQCDVPAKPGRATLRHIDRRLRAGKTVKDRRRRATVRREKFRACHCSEFRGGKAARRSSAEPGDRRSPQPRKPETIPDTRTTLTSRASRERSLHMRFSVLVLRSLCFAAFLIVVSIAPRSVAQPQTARISGIVTDPQGSVIAEAQISAESIPPVGSPAHGVSASDGRFSLSLPPGRYRVTIGRDSFARADQEITIAAGETRELQVRLALEPLSSKVVVTAQALPLDAESSPAPLTILTREQIDQRVATSLPDLLATQPGFSLGRTGPEGGSASLFL